MMEITRDVILDLLPLYVAGEVSSDTSSLVEEYLQNDPQLAKLVEQSKSFERLEEIPVPLISDAKMAAYKEARHLQQQRTILWAVVIAVIILAFLGLVSLAALFLFSV